MAILNRDEYFQRVNSFVAEDSSESSIQFLEDMTDTYNSLERQAKGDGVDWEQKYHELDASWAKKYRNRFFSDTENHNAGMNDIEDFAENEITINDLFKEV